MSPKEITPFLRKTQYLCVILCFRGFFQGSSHSNTSLLILFALINFYNYSKKIRQGHGLASYMQRVPDGFSYNNILFMNQTSYLVKKD